MSPELMRSGTDAVMAVITPWQAWPLEPMYPVVLLDALRLNILEDAVVRNKAMYLALGVLPDGTPDFLDLWIATTERAEFWMKIFNEFRTRGIAVILIADTDGLKGLGKELGAVFPATMLQACVVDLVRNWLNYASWKDCMPLAAALRPA